MRLATFNCENLFARYRFRDKPSPVAADGFTTEQMSFEGFDEPDKKLTAQAIKEVDADVIALQEVDSLPALDHFNSLYLKKLGYTHRMLIDGNDQRQIDVAVLSRHPFTALRTHRHERTQSARPSPLFSRDCLEAEIDVAGKPLVLYVNHLKSMMGGRDKTHDRRQLQAARVAEIVDARWKKLGYQGNFVVLGDMNDYPGQGTALDPLLNHKGLDNVLTRLSPDEQWTHFYSKGEYRQLDYLLLSKSLAAANQGKPAVMRKGLPLRAKNYTGPRFKGVGQDNPKSSDHAPLYMDIVLA